jgi:AbrB family looped-hinge helix DNA binding protein
MPTATISSKGQVTVPKEVRVLFHLEAGKRIDFQIDESSGSVTIVPINKTVNEAFGLLRRHRPVHPVSVEAMDAAIKEKMKRVRK